MEKLYIQVTHEASQVIQSKGITFQNSSYNLSLSHPIKILLIMLSVSLLKKFSMFHPFLKPKSILLMEL